MMWYSPKSLLAAGALLALAGSRCPAQGPADGGQKLLPLPTPHPPLLAYRTEYQWPPLGTTVGLHFQTQVNNGIAAHMTLYEYDFICGGAELNLHGCDRLVQLATFCKSHNYPLVVERTPYDISLAQARRVAVLNRLAALGFTVPPESVVIGVPLAIPLRGVEAESIYRNLLKQTESGGYQQGQGQGGATSNGFTGTLPPH